MSTQISPKSSKILSDFGFALSFNEYFNFVQAPKTNSAFKLLPFESHKDKIQLTMLNWTPISKMNIAYNDDNLSYKDTEDESMISFNENKSKIFHIQKIPKQVVKVYNIKGKKHYCIQDKNTSKKMNNLNKLNNDIIHRCRFSQCKRIFSSKECLKTHLNTHIKE